jgi:glycosyltransferase involved in cell wall biosynthesis
VKLLGTMNSDSVINEIKRADIYLSASLNEGISNAVIEAMAIGTIVISTDVNGMPELVKNNETGMLVRAFNHKEIEHAIISIIDKRIDRESIINYARLHVEKNFNIKKQSKIFDEQYKLSVNV